MDQSVLPPHFILVILALKEGLANLRVMGGGESMATRILFVLQLLGL